jgi:hypothetical protein
MRQRLERMLREALPGPASGSRQARRTSPHGELIIVRKDSERAHS